IAALPSSVEDISTNAKPRERPVSRSSITFTDSTVPACENNCCKSSLEVWNERLPTYSFIDILCVPLPAFRSKKRSFEPGVLRRNGNERRNERSNAQLSNFYGLTTNLPSNHPKRRAFISAGASPFMRERRSNRRLRCHLLLTWLQ